MAIVVTRAHLLLDRIRQPAAGHDPVGALVSDQTSGGAHLEGYEMNHQCILRQCRPAYDEALNTLTCNDCEFLTADISTPDDK